MNYHINTGLILQEFNDKCECPLCEIQKIVEHTLTDQFLNEAVMVDGYRKSVNEKGFCEKHYDIMLEKNNKLGLALQNLTRIKEIYKGVKEISSVKDAKKQASYIEKSLSTCLICELIDNNMIRYYKTVAEMFYNEKNFETQLLSTKGFCLRHYAELLKYASFSKSKVKDYIALLSKKQIENNERILSETQWFCDKHDYRNADKPIGSSQDVLVRTRTKIYGKK